MKFTITRSKKKLSYELAARERLRLYAVPEDYSPDGLLECLWSFGQLEPVPACDAARATLLADVGVRQESAGDVLVTHYLAKGVTCAQA